MKAGAFAAVVVIGCGGGSAVVDAPADAPCASDRLAFEMQLHGGYSISGTPLAGAHVCAFDQPDLGCADSDASGRWMLCLPPQTDVALTFEIADYEPTIFPIRVPASLPLPPYMAQGALQDNATSRVFWDEVGVPYPPTTQGLTWVRTHTNAPPSGFLPPNLGDVSAAFMPAAAQGPFYQKVDNTYDPTATHNIVEQPDIFAAGLVEGSTQVVVLSHPTLATCTHLDGGWTSSIPNGIRIPVRAGFRTTVFAKCF